MLDVTVMQSMFILIKSIQLKKNRSDTFIINDWFIVMNMKFLELPPVGVMW